MKMLFKSNEVVKVSAPYCGKWDVSKQDIADFLVVTQREEEYTSTGIAQRKEYYELLERLLERTVILSNLTNVISIEIESSDTIRLYPIGIKMIVSKYIIQFLCSKSKYN